MNHSNENFVQKKNPFLQGAFQLLYFIFDLCIDRPLLSEKVKIKKAKVCMKIIHNFLFCDAILRINSF